MSIPEDEITSFATLCPQCDNLIPRGRVEDGDNGSKRLTIVCAHCNTRDTTEVTAQSISRGPFRISRSPWDGVLHAVVAICLGIGAVLAFGVWLYRFLPVIGWVELCAVLLVFGGLSFLLSTGTLHILRDSRERRSLS